MPHTAQLFADFSDDCRTLVRGLAPLLNRDGAEFYDVMIDRQVRVGWRRGSKHRVLGTLQGQRNGLKLYLRVGRHSRFLGDGMLEQDRTHLDDGTVLLQGDTVPAWLSDAIDEAFGFALENDIGISARRTRPGREE
jgi:hypothetical protein